MANEMELTTAMNLNILDRIYELGVIRAIGASTRDILQIIILEGTFIGALSWGLAVILSIPYSQLMGQIIAVFLESLMDLTTSLEGWIIWLFTVIVIASIASAFPAWNAAKQPVNEVLAYE
jgi:putative ABC transport system permease protein